MTNRGIERDTFEKVCWDWVNEWITVGRGGVKSFSNFRACSFLGYQIEWSFVKGHGVSES